MNNEQKVYFSYKFMASLFSFLFSFACLAATTFAWFIVGSQVGVPDLEFGIMTDGNILVGLKIQDEEDAIKYDVPVGDIYYPEDSIISMELLEELDYIDHQILMPVSSAYQEEWVGSGDTPILRKLPTATDFKGITAASSGFYQIEFYFKVMNDIYLNLNEETTVLADATKNIQIAKSSEDLDNLNKVEDCLRVGIYMHDKFTIFEPNVEQSSATPLFGKLDIIDGDGYYDFDYRNHVPHEILFGQYENPDKIVEGTATIIPGQNAEFIDCFTAETFSGTVPVDVAASIENGINGKYQQTKTLDVLSLDENLEENGFGLLKKGVDTRVVLSLWAEGWDVDCVETISRSNFIAKIIFGGNYPIVE